MQQNIKLYDIFFKLPLPELHHHFGEGLLMVLSWQTDRQWEFHGGDCLYTHITSCWTSANCRSPSTRIKNQLCVHLPAYCLANLAMSSLLKTYCFVAIQCCSNSTTRTATAANTSSFKTVLKADMAETKVHRNSCCFDYTWKRRQAGSSKHAIGRRGVQIATSGSLQGGVFILSQSQNLPVDKAGRSQPIIERFWWGGGGNPGVARRLRKPPFGNGFKDIWI